MLVKSRFKEVRSVNKKVYVATKIIKELMVGGNLMDISEIAGPEGLCGAMIVFANKRKAKKWAGKHEVLTFEYVTHQRR